MRAGVLEYLYSMDSESVFQTSGEGVVRTDASFDQNSDLTEFQKEELTTLQTMFIDVFAVNPKSPTTAKGRDIRNAQPVKQKIHHRAFSDKEGWK